MAAVLQYSLHLFAQTYGAGTYNNTTYSGSSTGSTTNTGSGGSTTSSGLTNTGIAIAGIVTIAALVLLTAVIVRIWRRPSKRVVETVENDEPVDPNQ